MYLVLLKLFTLYIGKFIIVKSETYTKNIQITFDTVMPLCRLRI